MQFDQLKRRKFLSLLGAATAWPLAAPAQQPERLRRVGALMGFAESDREGQLCIASFREALHELGWTEDRNIRFDIRWAALDAELVERFAKELVALKPDLILSHVTPTTVALLQQTRTIPIVFVWVSDPVGSGFVPSLARPDGNATGLTPIVGSLGGKWVELLKEIAPHIVRAVALFNPTMAPYAEYYLNPFKVAAASSAVEAIAAPVHNISELESVVAAQAREPNSGLVVMPDTFTVGHRVDITSLATRYLLPAVYWSGAFAEAGGLVSYGPDVVAEFRHAASYADRILNGAKPSELPVQAPVKFKLVINLKTARTLGINIPPLLLARSDELIE
jgi:putative tryptophan/tyrosine transport system substrate-binding protein